MSLKHAYAEPKTKQVAVKMMDSGYKKDQDSLRAADSTIQVPCVIWESS